MTLIYKSVIGDLRKVISEAHKSIEEIQTSCSHPAPCLEQVARSNTGNYDPSEDSYWYDFSCTLCEKHWTEDQ